MLVDIATFVSVTLWVVGLTVQDMVTVNMAAFGLAGLAGLLGVSRALRLGLAQRILRGTLPLAAVVTFLAWTGGGQADQMANLAAHLGALLCVLIGLYLMVLSAVKATSR
jgi:hypothetical protein